MSKHRIVFGTDGWRGVIADDYTFENVRICAQAFADELKRDRPAPGPHPAPPASGYPAPGPGEWVPGTRHPGCVIAYDNRFGSEDFAQAVAEVMAGNGIPAILCRPGTPTPILSFTIIDRKAAGGVIITASHNPAMWNGFKVRADYGGAAAPEVLTRLEQRIAELQRAGGEPPRAEGPIEAYDAGPRYEAKVREQLDTGAIRSTGVKIVHDAMFGVGSGWIERLVGGRQTTVIPVNAERNPLFPGINPEPIAKNLGALLAAVPRHGADLGIATDGDADRLGLCDEHGQFIDQLRAFSLIALYLLEVRGLRGPIVKTLSTSSMLDRLGELYDVPVHETNVGFKFVAPKMIETNAIVGGEESGGYAFGSHIPERDGILAGLFVADMVVKLGKRPSELTEYLFSKVGAHFYDRLDADFPPEKRGEIMARLQGAEPDRIAGERVVRTQTDDGFKWVTDQGSWLLIRFSGTEPIMRLYAETGDREKVRPILELGRELAGI